MKKKEIDELLEKGIITQEIADKIIQNEEAKKKIFDSKEKTSNLLNIIAAVLLACGVIWIIAANWKIITRILTNFGKVAIMLVLTIVSFIYLKNCKKKENNKKDSGKTLEFASILYGGITIATMSLITQIYNMQGEISNFFLLCLIAVTSIAIYSRSRIMTYISIISSTLYVIAYNSFFGWMFGKEIDSFDYIIFLVSMVISLIVGLGLVYLVSSKQEKTLENEESTFVAKQKWYSKITKTMKKEKIAGLLIISAAILSIKIASYTSMPIIAYAIVCAIMYIICMKFERHVQKVYYKWIFIIMLFISTIAATIHGIEYSINVIIVSVISLFISGFIFFTKKYKDSIDYELIMISTLVFPIASTIFLVDSSLEFLFLNGFSILLFVYSIRYIVKGTTMYKTKWINTGEIIFIAIVIRYFFEVDMSIMMKGLISISLGSLMLIYNNTTSKKIKAREENNNIIAENEKNLKLDSIEKLKNK